MAKPRKRTKRKNESVISLIDILLISLPIILIISSIFFIRENKNLEKKNEILQKNYNTLNTELNTAKENNTAYVKKIDLYNNIDKYIEEAKNNYFNTLKLFEEKISNKEIPYKLAYLTFDDGPYYSTYNFLKVLDEQDAFATFFTTNVNGSSCYDNHNENCHNLYKEYLKYGHTIANHTYTHSIFNGLYSSTNSFINAVTKQEEHIKNLTGYTTNIVRFPGGSSSANYYGIKNSVIEKLREKKYGWVDWTAQDGDGGYVPDTNTAWSNLKGSLGEDFEVILFHDYSKITLSILPDTIKYLKDNKYVIAPLFYDSKMVNK